MDVDGIGEPVDSEKDGEDHETGGCIYGHDHVALDKVIRLDLMGEGKEHDETQEISRVESQIA